MIFAVPLIFFPARILGLLGFQTTELIMARLVGAALVGIGGASLFNYNKTIESYKIMLTLKILWSSAAILGLLISAFTGAPIAIWWIITVFAVFDIIWIYYRSHIND